MASGVTRAQRTMLDAGFGPLRAEAAQDVIDTRDWLIDNTDYRMYLQPPEVGAGRGFVNPPSATAMDSMGQPLYGRSNYNALTKGREIIGGLFDDPLGTAGKLGDWLTYTTPDAQQLRTEINGRCADPRYSLIDQVAASPLGGSAYGITNLLGASPETQQFALGIGSAADGLLMAASAIKGQAPSFLGTQRPGAMDVESPYALTSNNYLSGFSRTDKMSMGIRLEANQGLLDHYSLYEGRTATQLYVRAFDANGNLLPGSVRLDRAGLRADGGSTSSTTSSRPTRR